jgi:hypothetical protein
LTNVDQRVKWDKSIDKMVETSKVSSSVDTMHTIFSSLFLLGKREFMTKRFIVPYMDEEKKSKKLIKYSSSLPEEFWKTKKKIIRGTSIFR